VARQLAAARARSEETQQRREPVWRQKLAEHLEVLEGRNVLRQHRVFRISAAEGLGRLAGEGFAPALEGLRRFLRSEGDPFVREEIAQAIETATGRDPLSTEERQRIIWWMQCDGKPLGENPDSD
jgi:hypothetical protein